MTQETDKAVSDRQAYAKAMRTGDIYTCIRIEKKHGLYGATPQMVSEALSAAETLMGESR